MEQKEVYITDKLWNFIEANVPNCHKRDDVLRQSELQNFIDGHESSVQGITRKEAVLLRNNILHGLFAKAIDAFTHKLPMEIPGNVCLRDYAETLVDIAYEIGRRRARLSDNSRETIGTIIDWADEFSRLHKDTDWNDKEYLDEIYNFTEEKLRAVQTDNDSETEFSIACPNRLKEDSFPILVLQKSDLAQIGFDARSVTDKQMQQLARNIAEDYCQSETSAGQNFWKELEAMAENLHLPRHSRCPACGHHRTIFDAMTGVLRCECCDTEWHEELYVLVEFPEDASFFEKNDIGYPSFGSRDNGARYVSEYDYIAHFQTDPAENTFYKPLRWPYSQPYLFPDEPNESIDALNEPINDKKGIEDFGGQAVWVPLCNLKN